MSLSVFGLQSAPKCVSLPGICLLLGAGRLRPWHSPPNSHMSRRTWIYGAGNALAADDWPIWVTVSRGRAHVDWIIV